MVLRVVSDPIRTCPAMKAVTGSVALARRSQSDPSLKVVSVQLYQAYRAGSGATKRARQTRMPANGWNPDTGLAASRAI
jgi:hypothetical protein